MSLISAGSISLDSTFLRSPGVDSKESILPAFVAWWVGTTPIPTQFLAPIDCSKIPETVFLNF
jgi:hypothetical protein